MQRSKADIIAQLKKDILPLGGFKDVSNSPVTDVGLNAIRESLPGATFPLGAVHEFLTTGTSSSVATDGFIAAILGRLMKAGGVSLWISPTKKIFPPALLAFGIQPDHIIFMQASKDKDILYIMEEGLKCSSLVAVVSDLQDLTLTASRRLQLAVEQSRVTCFVTRPDKKVQQATSCVTRWHIHPLSSALTDDMPGVGFPRWKVVLSKARNGKPGSWEMEWKAGRFGILLDNLVVDKQQQRKTG